jgi:NAD(P)-dependent dehydrogenase (short-subunit alcohol dehydrogenase family)
MADVEGRVAFITGGSSGIGLGIAEAFAEAGMKVVIGYRSAGHRDAAMETLGRFGDAIHPVEVDVADRASVEAAAAETVRRFGKVHVLVNNAGVAVLKPVAETTYEDWDWIVGINLTGVFNGIHAFLPLIREHGEGGQIVTTSSVMGLFTSRGHASYSATKFAVVGLMEGLRLDLVDTNIGASVFCPGNVWANLEARTVDNAGGTAPKRGEESDREERDRIRRQYADIVMDGLEAGRLVLRGVRNDDLYILTHPEFAWMIRERHEAIEASSPRDADAPEARIAHTTNVYHNPIYPLERDRLRAREGAAVAET